MRTIILSRCLLLPLIQASVLSAPAPITEPQRTPKEVVELLWKRATEGELLRPDGWQRSSGLFLPQTPFAKTGTIRVVSNYWGVEYVEVKGESAVVTMEYLAEAGLIDSKMRYSPPPKTDAFKSALIFHLTLADSYSSVYESDRGGKMHEGKTRTSKAWQITEPADPAWTTVNTAIRYVLEVRSKSKDTEIRKNADQTVATLLRFQ